MVIACLLAGCSDEELETRSYPSLDTNPVTDIDANGATLNAKILNLGTSGVADHGFVYDASSDPELDRSEVISLGEASAKGPFNALANRGLEEGKAYFVRAYCIAKTTGVVVYGQVTSFISQGGSAPEITGLTPKKGSIGDTVLIVGSAFSDKLANDVAKFGVVPSFAIRAMKDSLWFVVPTETKTGENSVALSVGQLKVVAKDSFLLKSMTLKSFTPQSTTFGDTITLSGTNFPLSPRLVTVNLFGVDTTIIQSTSTKILAVVPKEISIADSPIKIRAGVQILTYANHIQLLEPVISDFAPKKGTAGTEITITGDYFDPILSRNVVKINGNTLSLTKVSKSQIKASIPSGIAPGDYPIMLIICGQTVSSASTIEIVKPEITSVSPLHGTWGSTITISGANFGSTSAGNKVTFADVQAEIISASSTEIKVLIPNDLLVVTSDITVKAISVDNLTVTYSEPFTLDAPQITDFNPDTGKHSSQVTINGENFNPVSVNDKVAFGEFLAEVLTATHTQLIVKLPDVIADTVVVISVEAAGQTGVSSTQFHLISPWRRITSYPGSAGGSGVAFSIGEYGYVTLGNQPLFDKSCYKYDPANDLWTMVAPFSFVGSGTASGYVGCVAFSVGGYGYAGLGYVGGLPYADVSRYSDTDNKWTKSAPIGPDDYADGLASAVAYSINDKGYVTSGTNSKNKSDIGMNEYDPVSNTWTKKSPFPGTPRTDAAGFGIGNVAYLTTGSYLKDLWSYNVTTDTWHQLADVPAQGRIGASAFSLSGIGYLLGGYNGTKVLSDFWMYNPATDNWEQLPDFPGTPNYEAVVFTVNGKAYYGLKEFWEFDPSKL